MFLHLIINSSEIRGLCLMKWPSKMLQILSYFWNTKTYYCSGLENRRRLNHNLCFEKSSSLFLFWPLARISQKIAYFWLFSSFLEYFVFNSPWQRFYKCKQDEEKKERNILQNFYDQILGILSAVLRSNPS